MKAKLPDFYPLAITSKDVWSNVSSAVGFTVAQAKKRLKFKMTLPADRINYPQKLVLRSTTKGFYRCGICGILGHTKKICPKLEQEKDRDF